MKILTTAYLIITIIINSTATEAQGNYIEAESINISLSNYNGNSLMRNIGKRDAFRQPNFLLSWKLDVKFSLLKDVGILGDTSQDGKFDFIRDIFHSFKNLPNSVSRIHMYGNGKDKNTTMLIFGSVNTTWLENYIVNDLYNKGKQAFTYSKKTLSSGVQDITKLTIQLDANKTSKEKTVYFSTVKSGLYVISSNIYEVRRWRDYPKSVFYYKYWPRHGTLFSLQMDLERTIKNMKRDGVENIYMLKSKVFNESKDVNITIKEGVNNIFIGSYITTKDPSQAEELKQLFNDMLSSNNIKSNDKIRKQLFDNLEIVQDKNSLKIGSIITKAAFKQTISK